MDLAAAFYISVYCLAALAGGILAWAEGTASVAIFTAPIAIALLYLNERYRVLRLDGGWVALAGLMAFVFPAMEFFRGDEEFRLLSGAHLLVMLQWVLLAYHKTANQYWWICALSCLQVAIAAVLTTSPIFGIFILTYMFWALWTLSLYTLLLARLRFGLSDQPFMRKSAWVWPSLTRDAAKSIGDRDGTISHSGDESPRKFRKRVNPVSEFRGSFQCEPHETDLNWRFVFGISGMSASALFLGLILFLLTPRLWIGASPLQDDILAASRRGKSVTGFSEAIRLNDFGTILESSAPVMQLNFFDDATDATLSVDEVLSLTGQNEILMRGSALAIYDRGGWLPFEPRRDEDVPTEYTPLRPQPVPLIRQEIRLEPMGSNTLFTMGYPIYVKISRPDYRARRHLFTGALSLAAHGGLMSGAKRYVVKSSKDSSWKPPALLDSTELSPTYSYSPPKLKQLKAYAKKVLEPLKLKFGGNPVPADKIAQELLVHLRDSGQFRYSLDRSVIDSNLDAIEDFLANRKYGHCQYFASALALLLRTEGIPSCVITGFKGGLEDPVSHRVEIQERHAHAWVEAFIDGDWVTLDPTPADERELTVAAVGDRLRLWHQITTLGVMLWNDYVINLSFSKQQQDLYGPAQSFLQSVASQTKGVSSRWGLLVDSIRLFVSEPERWFSWQGGLVAFVLMLFLTGSFQLLRFIRRVWIRLWNSGQSTQREILRVEFHQRFLALLKPLGLVPSPTQTQREFADQVTEKWPALNLPSELQPLAAEIARAYDGIRFGAHSVTEEQRVRLLESVAQLHSHFHHSSIKSDEWK
jgi:hypothetical protein